MIRCGAVRTIRLLCEVAACRSFSLAATRQGVTQSAASQRIGRLEERLGVQLLDRSVRPLALTPAGEAFVKGCRELVERYDQLERQVAGFRNQTADGTVRVDAIYSAGIDLLNQIKEAFERDHQGVTVSVNYRRPQEVYEAVRDQTCDMGILSYPKRWPEVSVIPLRNERMSVVCNPRHPLARRESVKAGELGRWSMVGFEADLPVGRRIRKYLKDHGAQPQVTNMFDNIDTIKSAVAVTDDIAILPRRTVWREMLAGTLAVVELLPELVRPLGIIHHRAQSKAGAFTPAAQAFVDYLLKHAGPDVDLVQDLKHAGSEVPATNTK